MAKPIETDFNNAHLAYVVSNPGTEGDIEVYCPSFLPLIEERPEAGSTQIHLTITNADGTVQHKEIELADVIKCRYLFVEGAAHYMSVPQVVPGEKVLIRRFEGSTAFYWSPLRETVYLRTMDKLKLLVAAKPDQTQPLTADNAYVVDIDAEHKRVELSTSTQLGEPVKLSALLNAADGTIKLAAGDQATVTLDGVNAALSIVIGEITITINPTGIAIITPLLTINNTALTITETNLLTTLLSTFVSHVNFQGGTSGDRT